MDEFRGDQASGLRRLLTRDGMRVVAVAAGYRGAGGTTAVVNIAAALAAGGRQVLVIDENGGASGVADLLGLHPRRELRHATSRQCSVEEVMVQSPCGITLLSAAQGAHGLPAMRHFDEQRLLEDFARLGERFDIALIDTRDRRLSGLLGRRVQDVVLIATASASAVMGTYSFIKRCSAYRDPIRFHILVNDVGLESVAQVVFRNLQRAARHYLKVPLANLGWVPRDGAVQAAAARRQPVMAVFPDAPSAIGFGRVAASMAGWPGGHTASYAPGRLKPRISNSFPGPLHAGI